MSTESSRATWSYTYEKGLVETMHALVNIPMLKGQNGWTTESWRNITKQQVQEKEKEL